MQTFLMYDPGTGAVRGRCGNETAADAEASKLPGTVLLPIPDSHPAAVEYDYAAFYVEGDAAQRRQAAAITLSATSFPADGKAEVTVAGIPDGSVLVITGAVDAGPLTVTGGSVELTSGNAGEIFLALDCPAPFARWRATINAT